MKKAWIGVIAFVLSVALVACNTKPKPEDLLSQIYELSSSSYGEDETPGRNVISDAPVVTIDQDCTSRKSVELAGTIFELSYKESSFHPVGEHQKVTYDVIGLDEDKIIFSSIAPFVEFDENGSVIAARSFEIAKLDISPTDSYETVLSVLKPAISDIVDFSKYTDWRLTDGEKDADEDEFHHYHYKFYNSYEGYYTDYAIVAVIADGSVVSIIINEVQAEPSAFDFEIDREMEEELLLLKAQDLARADSESYYAPWQYEEDDVVKYEFMSTPQYECYDGELYLRYRLLYDVYPIDSEEPKATGLFSDILIPVELMTA